MELQYKIGHNLLGMVQMGNLMSIVQLKAMRRYMNEDTSGTFTDLHKLALDACMNAIDYNITALEKDFTWLIKEREAIEKASNESSNG